MLLCVTNGTVALLRIGPWILACCLEMRTMWGRKLSCLSFGVMLPAQARDTIVVLLSRGMITGSVRYDEVTNLTTR